jgi:MATE family multidrug resistance protein
MDSSQDQTKANGSWLPKIFRDTSATSKDPERTPDERTSLLASDGDHAAGETHSIGDDAKGELKLVGLEFWILFKGSIPVIMAYSLQNSLQTISVLIAGRLGPEALAVSAFCYSKYPRPSLIGHRRISLTFLFQCGPCAQHG